MARRAGRLAAEVLGMIEPHVVPGVSTETLDRICHDHIVNVQGAIPANLGYHGYPKTILTSVNQVVCHGIPSPDKLLKKGDIINIDVAVNQDGWFGDTSRMYFVGTPNVLARRLVETTYEALLAGIRQVRPGATLGTLAMPSSPSPIESTSAWCASTAGTALAGSTTKNRTCFTMAGAARGSGWSRGWSSPSNPCSTQASARPGPWPMGGPS